MRSRKGERVRLNERVTRAAVPSKYVGQIATIIWGEEGSSQSLKVHADIDHEDEFWYVSPSHVETIEKAYRP